MTAAKTRAENDLRTAIHSLQNALPKTTRADMERVSFPQFDDPRFEPGLVDKNATALDTAIDQLIQLRTDRIDSLHGTQFAKEYVCNWYRSTYPFAKTFVVILKEGAASIPVLNPYGILCAGLLVLMEIGYDESGRGEEIDEMMKGLSIPLRRLKSSEKLAGVVDSPEATTAKIAALNLLTIIVQCLTAFIRYFTDNPISKIRNRFTLGNPTLQDLRLKLKAASLEYTEAMVDLGAAKSDEIIDRLQTGFSRMENQIQSANKPPSEPLDSWLSISAEVNAKERNRYLSMQEATSPAWIVDLPEFAEWLQGSDTNNLWLSATTGFGKSVLASFLTDQLGQNGSQVVYFFCNFDIAGLQTADRILKTILYQLSDNSPAVRSTLTQIWEKVRSISDGTASLKYIVETLLSPAVDVSGGTTYFILDALNECPPSSLSDIFSLLRYVGKINSLRIIVTSQRTEEIAASLSTWKSIELQANFAETTIESYVDLHLTTTLRSWFSKADKDPIKFFSDTKTGHRGMFIWVKVMLEYLRDAYDFKKFQQLLSDVPDTITKLYQGGLLRLASSHSQSQNEWIREMFSWIALPQQDLSIPELKTGMISTAHARTKAQDETEDVDIERILASCSAFVRVYTDPTTKQRMVSVIHNTFTSFLTSRKDCPNEYFLDKYKVWHYRTIGCMQYLSTAHLSPAPGYSHTVERQIKWDQEYPLFRIAAESWSSLLYYLGPSTYNDRSGLSGMINDVLELAKALCDFVVYDTLKVWVVNVLRYSRGGFKYIMGTLVAKPLVRVTNWLDNHEEYFRLKVRGNKLEVQPFNTHITKYLKLSQSYHLSRLQSLPSIERTATAPLTPLPKARSWHQTFHTPNPSKFQAWAAKCLCDVWLSTRSDEGYSPRSPFIELALLYVYTQHMQELKYQDDVNSTGSVYSALKSKFILEYFPKDGSDHVKTVQLWARPDPTGSPGDSVTVQLNLADAYLWYGAIGELSPKDFERAIERYREAVKMNVNSTYPPSVILVQLSLAEWQLFSELGETEYLNKAIEDGRNAWKGLKEDTALRVRLATSLCNAFIGRAYLDAKHADADIKEAIALATSEIKLHFETLTVHGDLTATIIKALFYRYLRSGSDDDFMAALEHFKISLRETIKLDHSHPLKALYQTAFESSTLSIPASGGDDPFDVFLVALKDLHTLLAGNSGADMFNFMSIPNFIDQYDMLEDILSFVNRFYQYRGRYALSEHYCRVMYRNTQDTMNLLEKEFGERDEWSFEVADDLIDLGEVLWLQSKEAEAKDCFDKAIDALRKKKANTADKKLLIGRVMRNDWKMKTQFSDYFKSKESSGQISIFSTIS